jgi:hypothetical protein
MQYGPEIEKKILKVTSDFMRDHSFLLLGYRNEFRIAHRASDERTSLIIMADISGLDIFYEKLRNDLGIEIDNQPTHCTLYTGGLDDGIGINNVSDLSEMTKILTDDIPQEVMRIFGF